MGRWRHDAKGAVPPAPSFAVPGSRRSRAARAPAARCYVHAVHAVCDVQAAPTHVCMASWPCGCGQNTISTTAGRFL